MLGWEELATAAGAIGALAVVLFFALLLWARDQAAPPDDREGHE